MIAYVRSSRYHPVERLKIILGLEPNMPYEDLPFSNMDLLYRHMFSTIPVENITMVLKILGLLTLKLGGDHSILPPWTPFEETDTIVAFLSLKLGDIERCLGALP